MPKLWIQVVGTQRPTQVQYEDGDNVDDLITAAKAKMPNTLTADPSFIKASKDEGGQDELPVAFLISDLKKEKFLTRIPYGYTCPWKTQVTHTGTFLNCTFESKISLGTRSLYKKIM